MTALLLAEAEPTVRGFLERQLRNDGFDVVACERAEQLPRAADPDVLVLGDAAALDRGVMPDCPVIVLGGADPAARVRALARADDCLARPFVYEELFVVFSSSPPFPSCGLKRVFSSSRFPGSEEVTAQHRG
jgi:DNA-binding response OmpR family regulator